MDLQIYNEKSWIYDQHSICISEWKLFNLEL